jgi:hypothetical protein
VITALFDDLNSTAWGPTPRIFRGNYEDVGVRRKEVAAKIDDTEAAETGGERHGNLIGSAETMARFKPLFIAAGALLLVAIGIGTYNVVGRSLIEAREAACSMNLGSIGRKVAEFRATRQRYPLNAGERENVPPEMLVDSFSGRVFVWAQKPPEGTQPVPLVRQPAPYRTGPWPFGVMRQIALFSDGTLGDCLTDQH